MNLTSFSKSDGPLTKRISLAADGSLRSDASACIMAHGAARRVQVASVKHLAGLIEQLHPNQAIALGTLRSGLPDQVEVVTKQKLNGSNGTNVIARTGADIVYQKGQPALALIDFDSKGMPADVATALRRHGGVWPALVAVLPALQTAAHLSRRSTSAGLFRLDTGEKLPGSDGVHVYVAVHDGAALDTLAACPPLTIAETSRLRELKAKQAQRLAPEAAKARAAFIGKQVERLVERTGMAKQAAARAVVRQSEGVLLPDIALPFDDPELAGCTVGDVLADPERFEGTTLADPLEGVEYGTCKARIMRRADGTPWIHSFAHGRTVYGLKLDARAVQAVMMKAADSEVVQMFIDLAMAADLNEQELENLRNLAAERSGTTRPAIAAMLKASRRERAARHAQEEHDRRLAERHDPRPLIQVPAFDEPWLPQMETINEILGNSAAAQPPTRDIDGTLTRARKLRAPNMHGFNRMEANAEQDGETRLPAPEQWLLSRMTDIEGAELIEKHIDYVDIDGRSVHLPTTFVRHYLQRDDGALPTVVAIATLPLVLPDGTLLAPDGLNRDRGIIFIVPNELRAILPRREGCTEEAVREAMRFLCEEWLCDVATDYVGKATIIAAALTVIERSLLPDRPAFFVTAGRRGGGKTTLLTMLIAAVTGLRPAAAAWSTNEEERRKALLSYFMSGVAYILWDNIARGSQISCPHIEKSCTAAYYSDRKLGVSEMVSTAASTVHFFTGNNISPRGDLASRSLHIRLEVDRPDPENRKFKHPDPVAWTEDNRAEILQALYTILLGSPALKNPRNAAAKTRFKQWWRMIGSAVEHAARLTKPERDASKLAEGKAPDQDLDFQNLFLSQEEDEEDSASLAEALAVLARTWRAKQDGFSAADVAQFVNEATPDGVTLRDFLFPAFPSGHIATPKAVGRRLKSHIDEPVQNGDRVFTLRAVRNRVNSLIYHLHVTKADANSG